MSLFSDIVQVVISDDSMEVRIYISSTPDETGISKVYGMTAENLLEVLAENGVKSGINNPLINAIIAEKQFDRYHIIAAGKHPESGKDGYYTYNFKTETSNKPVVLEDGSVDYRASANYEQVTENTLIAEYHTPTPGSAGFDVHGTILQATPGKDLTPLSGEGFTVSEDGTKYYSAVNGKIEIKDGKLTVSNLLDFNGDVDLTTGDIIFNGDVIIHGNVLTGSMIKAGGSVTIMGNVEGVTIQADGDIILKSGMQGSGKGLVESNGEIWGKFFEHTKIICKKDLHANSLLNCDAVCEGDLYIHGRHGIIVGGSTKCSRNIYATVLGNMSEVKTEICVGMNTTTLTEIQELENDINDYQQQITKHNTIIEKMELIKNPTDQEKYDLMLKQVKASLHELTEKLSMKQQILDQKLFLIESASQSIIKVDKYMYPGVFIILNGLHYTVKNTFNSITIKSSGGVVQFTEN